MAREAESRLHGEGAESEIGSPAGREEDEPRVSSSRADSAAPAGDVSFRSSGASSSFSSLVYDVESDDGDGGFPRTQCEYEEIPSFRWIATPLRWWKTKYTVGESTPILMREVHGLDFGPGGGFWMNFPKAGSQLTPRHRAEDFKLKDYCPMVFRYTVGKITPIPMREIRASDFGPRASYSMNFPKSGSQLTPPHCAEDFKLKDYCPIVFRNLRAMFKIDAADYMISICGSAALKELSSGKSGSAFFLSQDDRFMIKTLRKSEVQVLLRMLPNYYHHVLTYESTLITKFFGLHCVKPSSGRKFRFVVMGNILCTELRIHRRYELKGSWLGRSTDKVEIDENTTLKDLDLNYCFYLEPSWRDALLKQIMIDSKFLETQHIIDYSLLLGVHYRAPQNLQSQARSRRTTMADGLTILSEDAQDDDISNYPQGLVSVPRGNEENSIILGPHIRGGRLRASAAGDEEVDLLLPGTARLQIQLGVNMPARAEHCAEQTPAEDESQLFHQLYDVVLYLGIIDILQEYNMSKKIEHAYKSLQFDSLSISAVDPMLYSTRFMGFIEKVFPEMKISDS